jgi:cell division protein ZapA
MDQDDASRVVHVEIHGAQYPIRSGLDPAYVAELAAYVDQKMRAASRETSAADSLKVAVLAALNIADECFRMRTDEQNRRESMTARAEELERMLDLALGLDEAAPSLPDGRNGGGTLPPSRLHGLSEA